MRIKTAVARLRLNLPLVRPRHVANCTVAYGRDRIARGWYRTLTENEVRAERRSDTVFILGAGKSLSDISAETWQRIAGHDTLSFSEFFRQPFIAPRFHMIGEVANIHQFGAQLSSSSHFAETILFAQGGWRAEDANSLLGERLLRQGTPVFRYRRTSRGRYRAPTTTFSDGVAHGWNSSISATNIAYILGWKQIVLAGIDLYDKQYFWLAEGERRVNERPDLGALSPFPNAPLIVEMLGRWHGIMQAEGVKLEVYNPRSLLAEQLPVFSWDS